MKCLLGRFGRVSATNAEIYISKFVDSQPKFVG